MTKTISLETARTKLISIWLSGAGLALLLLIFQTLNKTFEKTTETDLESFAQQVWGWFIPLLFPTLSLMLGSLAIKASTEADDSIIVNKKTYRICLSISIVYLLILLFHIYFWPLFNYKDPMKLFATANFYLGPLQGITVMLISMLFNKKD